MKDVNEPLVLTKMSKLLLVIFAALIMMSTSSQAALQVAANNSKSVLLSWSAPGDDGNNGMASVYDIRYSTSMITEQNWNQADQAVNEPFPSVAGTQESFTVDNLEPSTTYYFAIKAGDEVPNWSVMSNVVVFTTTVETIAPDPIANLSSSEQTQTSITLDWTATGDDGTTGTATTYEIRFSTSPITSQNWDQASLVDYQASPLPSGSDETVTITGLEENTQYYFSIKVADEVPNWSGMSNVLNVSTTQDNTPPASINDLQAFTGDNNGELTLSWTAPGDDGTSGQVSQYLIRYATYRINNNNWMDPVDSNSNFIINPLTPGESGALETYTIEDLVPGTQYFVAMKAADDIGNQSKLSNVSSAPALLDLSLDINDELAALPKDYMLSQNYPNPFNPSTEIKFSLPEEAEVELGIYNSLGQKIATLVEENLTAGQHLAAWDGRTDSGSEVTSGIYFYRISANDYTETKKMVMMK